MQKEEFEERTGWKVSASEYATVERAYMLAGEMDKDAFCRHWKECGKNPLVVAMIAEGLKREEREARLEKERRQLLASREEEAEFLLGKSCAYDDSDFRDEAIRLIGERAAVAMKLKMLLPVWEEDRGVLLDALEGKKEA